MWLIWAPVGVALAVAYVVIYTLLRTSGDGRDAWTRLRHPRGGGLQEEYGGTGRSAESEDGNPHV